MFNSECQFKKHIISLILIVVILFAYIVLPISTITCAASKPNKISILKPENNVTAISNISEDLVEPIIPLKSNQEIAQEIIEGKWGTGSERILALTQAGYDANAIQELVDTLLPKQEPTTQTYSQNSGSNVLTKSSGVCYNNPYGYKETWYSQRVLPGNGLKIPGRHVDERGIICDENGYICVAISINDSRFPYGTIIQTSLGDAKVYDHGCALGVIDVYVNW